MKKIYFIIPICIGLGFVLIQFVTPNFNVKAQSGYRPTPTPWLPMTVEVLPEANYHNGIDQINVLPVAHCLASQDCPWVGDLTVTNQVKLIALSSGQDLCFIEGKAIQGWDIKGWVPCYRLKPVSN